MTDINTPTQTLSHLHAALEKVGHNEAGVHYCNKRFLSETGESDKWLQSFTISPQTWVELGRPDVITTAVAVGDRVEEVAARAAARHEHSLPVRLASAALLSLLGLMVIATFVLMVLGIILGLQNLIPAVLTPGS